MGVLFSSLWSLFWPEKKRKVIIVGASHTLGSPHLVWRRWHRQVVDLRGSGSGRRGRDVCRCW